MSSNLVHFSVDENEQLPRIAWRELVKLRANYRCEECKRQLEKVANKGARGHRPDAPHAHHINGDDKDNCLSNGQCLCLSCHARKTTSTERFKISMKGNKNALGFKHSKEHKKKVSERWKGVPKDEEHKRKISESLKKRWEKIHEQARTSS